MKSEISVIIPAYNVEKYIGKLLLCLEKQSLKPLEIIIVDDGSTDGTAAEIKKHKGVILLRQENKGVSAARNAALEAARGKYIAFLDADDFIAESYLEKLYTAAEKDNADVVRCNFVEFKDGSVKALRTSCAAENTIEYAPGLVHNFDYTVWAGLYKKSLLKNNGIRFVEGENYAEDAPFCMLTNALAEKLSVVNGVLYFHRIRSDSAVSGVRSGRIKPSPPLEGMRQAAAIYSKSGKKGVEKSFFEFCALRNIASFLTTQYMFRAYNGEFRKKLCKDCGDYISSFFPNALDNPFIFSSEAKRLKSHPLVIRAAVRLMLRAWEMNRLYEFSCITAAVLRILNRKTA